MRSEVDNATARRKRRVAETAGEDVTSRWCDGQTGREIVPGAIPDGRRDADRDRPAETGGMRHRVRAIFPALGGDERRLWS
jgi:hypothetical protein